ncbi:MAG TPA: response regulator [Acidobacteriota bacterium]
MPTVLIADDSLSVRKVAERLLIAAGFDVALAANGEEALERFSASKPDVLIADVIMPDKSGFEVCAYVRSHATLSGTPVLLISGVVDEEITRQAAACRADGVIKKPFHGTSLPDRVLALLASKQRAALAQPEPTHVPKPKKHADYENIPGAASPSKISGITEDHLKNVRVPDTDNAFENAAVPKIFRITEDQLGKVLETATLARDVESRMSEAQHRTTELEQENSAFREAAMSAAARIRELEVTLAEQQKRPGALDEQNSAFREAAMSAAGRIGELEATLAEEQKRTGVLEEQDSTFREAAMSAAGRIRELEVTLAEEQKRSTVLVHRVGEMEHAASCARKLADIFAEIGRLGPKA